MRTIIYHSFVVLLVWTICDAASPSTSAIKPRSLTIPFPRVGRSQLAAQNNVPITIMTAPSTTPVKSRSLIPFPRVGRSRLAAAQNHVQVPGANINSSPAARDRNSMREFKRHLIPFPRVGKRQSLIPFPRVGRSQQYLNYPADDVSSEVGNVPEVDLAGIFVGSENEMVPVFDMQGLGERPVYGQLRWQQGSQELEE